MAPANLINSKELAVRDLNGHVDDDICGMADNELLNGQHLASTAMLCGCYNELP